MAEIEEGIYTRLRAVTAVTDLVGSGSSARIYRAAIPQKPTYPLLMLQRISAQRESAMGADSGDVMIRLQVDSWAVTIAGAQALATAVRGALQRWSGASESITFQDVFLEEERQDSEEIEPGQLSYRASQDFMVWAKE